MSAYDVAIVGATGVVGRTMLAVIEERRFPVGELRLVASHRSAGERLRYRDRDIVIESLAEFDFAGIDIALFSAGRDVSRAYAPRAASAGCIVIDNTSEFRYDDDVPLVVPEVNASALAAFERRRIIANPNCSTIQMVVALKPLYDAVGIERVNVATYQSVSGAGQSALDELERQSLWALSGQGAEPQDQVMAFNVIPRIDKFAENGYTLEEMKMVWETRKIIGDEKLRINATAARVPVLFGHSEAIHLETREKLTVARARELLLEAPGVRVCEPGVTAREAAGGDWVWVGRIREDISHERGLDLWVVADNVRKGAATNSVQIAEILVNHYL